VLISGEEEFLMERTARDEAVHSLASETSEYWLPDQLDAFLLDSQVTPLAGGKRAFILWGAKEVPPVPDAGSDLFVVVSKKPLQDKRAARSLKFPKLKSYPENNEVVKWVLKEGERLNIDLSRVAGALFVNTGNCLRKLSTEIEKFSAAVPQGTVVSPEDARPLMCFSADISPKEIIESICDGQTVRALAFYDRLQERGDETGWIIAFMLRHALQQLKFELLHERRVSDEDAAASLGVPLFVFRKMQLSRRGLWSGRSLKASLETLCDLDVAHKRGEAFVRFGLESEVVRLSEEARDVKRH